MNAKQTMEFWNDTHKLTMIIEPLDAVEPEIQIPTEIKLKHLVVMVIPTNTKLKHII